MKSDRNIVRVVGVLFIVQMVSAVLSHAVILQPIFNKTTFLNELAANQISVRLAMLFDLICGASVLAIAILLFPVLKQFSERVALWYVGQRLTEFISFMISGFLLLTLLEIGLNISDGTVSDPTQAESIANYLRNSRSNVQIISLLIYCLGAWSFYGLLFYSKLIPRFISVWGIIGVSLLFIEMLANVFDTEIGGIMIMMPLGLNELFLGMWLIIKGFRNVQRSSE